MFIDVLVSKLGLAITGLVSKLVSAGAVAKQKDNDLVFTVNFGAYVYGYASANRDKIGNLSGWREMLSGYCDSFKDLSNDEVAAVAVLLDYHLNETQYNSPRLRRKLFK